MTFVHLHVHSHFSLLDGLSPVEGYVKRAADFGQPAVAITDHGSLSGLYRLWKAARVEGVKPIAGCEFYIAPEGRRDKKRADGYSGSGAYGHITVLAKNAEGVRNLYRLQAEAYRTGFYRKPRIDVELLAEHREGLIVLTGCPSGILATRILQGDEKGARTHLHELKDIFGEDLYAEVMYHGIEEDDLNDRWLANEIATLAAGAAVPTVVTGDAHYVSESDNGTHSALLCVQTHSTLDDPNRFKFNGSGYHLLSAKEVERVLHATGVSKAAAARTLEIAERVGSYDEIFERQLRMPKARCEDSLAEIVIRAQEGLMARVADADISDYQKRLEYELDIINGLGFADYFLVLADILDAARKEGVRLGPARGSAGGSLVAYALGITALDPLKSGLLFERFLNPARPGLPDIDVDIAEDQRERVLGIARDLYGERNVAQIGTFSVVGAKAALKDAARVLGHPYKVGEERTLHLPPPKFGRAPSLAEYTGPEDDIYNLAVGLEGTIRSESIHAAAVIISPEPLDTLVPIRYPTGKGEAVTCFDMYEIEELGFVKQDFLGLRTLKVIDECLNTLGGSVALPTAPEECNDPATYELLSRGDTLGVFQLDGSGMRGLLRQVNPKRLEHIAAVLALYRPGPMGAKADREYALRRVGRNRITYPHAELAAALEPILRETYGLIVYQEQVLEALNAVAGYNYSDAELIFNAMRKKDHAKMEAAKPDLVARMKEHGYSEEAIDSLWGVLVPFADYSFNKSHATGYALIAYWTAYLKANFPAEWMAALLSNEPDSGKLSEYLDECRRMGIEILPPDVNTSGATFTSVRQGVRYGLAMVKGVGVKSVEALIGSKYDSLQHFYLTAPNAVLNVGVLRALISSGALDSLCPSREGHMELFERLAEKALLYRQARKKGQRGLASPVFRVPDRPIDLPQRRRWERESLGVEVSFGEMVLEVSHLDIPGLHYLRELLEKGPGACPVRLDFGHGATRRLPHRIAPRGLKRRLEALGVRMEER